MSSDRKSDVEIFTEAIQLADEERPAFLDRACADDAELRGRIEGLLRANARTGDFMETPPTGSLGEVRTQVSGGEKPGDQIDKYKLLQQIGEGGCGIVFMAEQERPVRRRVALKIIKPGMDTKSVIARFEAERQALALMNHPNIAHVFDAGTTGSGRPYFVMELVEGVKITEYCDQHSLPTSARLQLFAQVCEAIQHAHQKGIIHRDIKPSNVLVTTWPNGKPSPKVIDFGIAKAIGGQHLTDKTIFTARDMLIGTPAYMSPEQAELASADLDTRTDIYSLGALLYELLTSTTPFDTKELLKAGFDEVRRVIREEEPVRPSVRLRTTVAAELAKVSRHHGGEAPKLIREMRGDLDWIVMKALEKDRSRRYETANGFAMDVGRYLSGDPILARPPSAGYKFQKLFLRHKLGFATVGVIFILLIAALAVTTRLFIVRQRQVMLGVAIQLESKGNSYVSQNRPRDAEAALRESLAIRRKYLDSEPPTDQALKNVLNSMADEDRRLEAVELLNQILTPAVRARPDCINPIAWRAELCAQYGRWKIAASDAMLVAQRKPDDHGSYHMLAPLLVATTNLSAYQDICHKIVARYGDTTDIAVADRMAKDCLILPSAGVDLKIVAGMAERGVTRGKGQLFYHFLQCCHALAQYRIGNYSEAVTWAQASATNSFPHSQAEAFAVLAMAKYKLGNQDEALQALSDCNKVIETRLPALGQNLGLDWKDWIIAHTLQKEADNLINQKER